jgi:hypothetical protein
MSSTSSDSFIKLKKHDAPTFSGLPREFTKFKPEFNSIVAVPGRPNNEIGLALKNAVPEKINI